MLRNPYLSLLLTVAVITAPTHGQSQALSTAAQVMMKHPVTAAVALSVLAVEEAVCRAQGKTGLLESLYQSAKKDRETWERNQLYEIRIFEAQLHAQQSLRAIAQGKVAVACPSQPMTQEMRRFAAETILLLDDFGVYSAISSGRDGFITRMDELSEDPIFVKRLVAHVEANKSKLLVDTKNTQASTIKRTKPFEKECLWGGLWDLMSGTASFYVNSFVSIVTILFFSFAIGSIFDPRITEALSLSTRYGLIGTGVGLVILYFNHQAMMRIDERMKACSDGDFFTIDRLYQSRGLPGRLFQRSVPWLTVGLSFGGLYLLSKLQPTEE